MADRPILFVDRSLGKGVGRRLRDVGAAVEIHDDHFAQTTADSEWIPIVSARGWVILTKDKNIRRPRGEREDILLASARVFTLTSGNMTGAAMAQAFIDRLVDIERIAISQIPPFVYAIGPGVFQLIFGNQDSEPIEQQPNSDAIPHYPTDAEPPSAPGT